MANAPYNRIPVFVRSGSIIPFGPSIQYSDEKQPGEITLAVYTGADATFTLYEDEGTNYNYEKGKYATIPFRYDEATGTLTIGERKGTYKNMLQRRKYNIVFIDHSTKAQKDLNVDSMQGTSIEYSGKECHVSYVKKIT